jgi:protein-S-isoprenylcysteine O-methyltransferase Ste14
MAEPGPNCGFRGRGGPWVIVQALLMAAALACAGVPTLSWHYDHRTAAAGAALIAAGAWLGIRGAIDLGANRTAYPRPREGGALIQTGIYAWVRHPLYTSVMTLCLGWSLLWRSGCSLGFSLALIPFFNRKARLEEHWLAAVFPQYLDYAKRTPRFIPNPWRRRRS